MKIIVAASKFALLHLSKRRGEESSPVEHVDSSTVTWEETTKHYSTDLRWYACRFSSHGLVRSRHSKCSRGDFFASLRKTELIEPPSHLFVCVEQRGALELCVPAQFGIVYPTCRENRHQRPNSSFSSPPKRCLRP